MRPPRSLNEKLPDPPAPTARESGGYTFDDAYLRNHVSLGNANLDLNLLRSRRSLFVEPRFNYQLFSLKHPELLYVRGNPRLLETANRYFDEEAYAFRVTEKPVEFPVYDFSRLREPLLHRRPGANGFLLGTSLAFKRVEIQQAAVETWLSQGFDVLSVNYPEEIEKLRPLFPEVRFVPNTRDSLKHCGRKLVYLDDIFQALKAQAGPYEGFGLVNSDLNFFELDLEKLKLACREGVVFSHRLDMPERLAYLPGLDAFFMNEEALDHCRARSTNFLLGAPWWDYYMPALVLAGGLRLIQAIPPLCGHVSHSVSWNYEEWNSFFEQFFPFFKGNISKMPILDKAKLEGHLPATINPEVIADLFMNIFLSLPDYANLCRLESLAEAAGQSHPVSFREILKPAAILGNGPSLKGFDFQNNLCGYATFGMNAAYRFWDRINWYPDYYSCLDLVVGLSHKDEIRRLIERADEYGLRGFLLRDNLIKELGPAGRDLKVTSFEQLGRSSTFLVTPNLTTGSHTMAWAACLGYRDIVLLGIDANYVPVVEGARRTGITLEMIKTPEANPNYFFDDYQRQGDRYHLPNIQADPDKATHLCGWRELKEPLRRHGVCVVNANPDSKVDAFPKCRFEEVGTALEHERARISLEAAQAPVSRPLLPRPGPLSAAEFRLLESYRNQGRLKKSLVLMLLDRSQLANILVEGYCRKSRVKKFLVLLGLDRPHLKEALSARFYGGLWAKLVKFIPN